MTNAKIQTVPTPADVQTFLDALEDETQRHDSEELVALMSTISGKPPVMWGPAIIGFGSYHYRYESGREGDMPQIGFSPRKGKLSLYITNDPDRYTPILGRLGKHNVAKACIYINKLADVDPAVLKELIEATYNDTPKA